METSRRRTKKTFVKQVRLDYSKSERSPYWDYLENPSKTYRAQEHLENISEEEAKKYYQSSLSENQINRLSLIRKSWKLLSGREKDVLTLILQGLTYKNIGKQLNISEKSVYVYIQRAKQKILCQRNDDLGII